ncbi:DUF3558 domain-containing protein [Williamsia sterculiae]|uniref:DUF3558 domain-containing protein n=1 Tax=Williamsia sterculiae TaxID=1344003 RepID=A0A1N7GPB2_9NOCA|nr:DUF3558 domain-containing protein [Williamsia sterculiae]SIS14425.1 Protein of unknown function [Williamsia sterculiae]
MRRRTVATALTLLALLALALTGCTRTVDGDPVAVGGSGGGQAQGNVDTDQFDRLLLECSLVKPEQIAQIVGGSGAESTFNGAICRWLVAGAVTADVTFNWFENGTMQVEKDTAKRLGYTTENVRVASQAAFTQRDPNRPAACAVTAKSPDRGIYTWWVEPRTTAATGDPCEAPTKLMELVLRGGQ